MEEIKLFLEKVKRKKEEIDTYYYTCWDHTPFDDAKEEYAKDVGRLLFHIDSLASELAVTKRRRDEARLSDECHEKQLRVTEAELDRCIDERDALRQELEHAKKERDDRTVAQLQLQDALHVVSRERNALLRRKVEELEKTLNKKSDFPKIICLCGSTRFTSEMMVIQWELTKKGNVVLLGDQEGVKEIVDEVHKRKIDLCDEVFVININGYIGNSTRSEIDYAIKNKKPVRYLEGKPDSP